MTSFELLNPPLWVFYHGRMTPPEGSTVTSIQSSPRDALNTLEGPGGAFFFFHSSTAPSDVL